ncbi:hypothetical protein F4824DRAFT_297315 [Ustulina deusta]|nr:hypothetical protein F4824DRAFT_297315 [Ustulina deusta]
MLSLAIPIIMLCVLTQDTPRSGAICVRCVPSTGVIMAIPYQIGHIYCHRIYKFLFDGQRLLHIDTFFGLSRTFRACLPAHILIAIFTAEPSALCISIRYHRVKVEQETVGCDIPFCCMRGATSWNRCDGTSMASRLSATCTSSGVIKCFIVRMIPLALGPWCTGL